MTVVAFSMHGEPRGKGRPRATVRGGHARMYTDAKTRAYENSIRAIAVEKMAGRPPLEGPISFSLRVRLSVPKSMSKRQRARVLAGEEAYFGSTDVDNHLKAASDALNGIIWRDDKQITRAFVEKVAAEIPGLDVRVEAHMPQGGA